MQKYALCKSGECKLKDYWEIRPAKLHPSDQQKFKRAITPIVSKDEKKRLLSYRDGRNMIWQQTF